MQRLSAANNLLCFSRLKCLLNCFQIVSICARGFTFRKPGICVYLVYEVCFCNG
jgi:hypothetical protein